MGSQKRSARKARRSAFERGLGDELGDVFAREDARRAQQQKQREEALRYKACERKKRYASEAEAKDAIRNFKNPITGEYVMEVYGLSPCREIGVLKEYVKEAILDGQIGNNFEEADALMRAKAAGMGLVPVGLNKTDSLKQ